MLTEITRQARNAPEQAAAATGARILTLRPEHRSGGRHGGYVNPGPPRTVIRPLHHTKQEFNAMNGSQTFLIHTIAQQRNDEIRIGAERERLISQVSRENGFPTVIERVRRIAGNALVRTGKLVGGERTPVRATDRVAAATTLRIAR